MTGTASGYTHATSWEVEGARVSMISCLRCGAALLLDPRDTPDVTELHERWHDTDAEGGGE